MSTRLINAPLRPFDGPAAEGTVASQSHDMIAVRAWARSRGYPIDESAGVPLLVLRTYRRVHGGEAGRGPRTRQRPPAVPGPPAGA